ncbi:radical SAM protein [Lentzea sp. NPDC092896]|uniref:radical SAM protein n=1 Tax=Lentzea sp. NPDC092896 TaxID=3364127 RepID=UPI0037FD58F2
MSANHRTLGLIVKASRQCNLRCTYCHDWRSHSDSMPFSTLAEMTWRALRATGTDRVEFIWHGGEPLLLGPSFYAKAIGLQQEFRADRHRITNSLQTNGTLLNADWCRFFRDTGFSIGVSIDGPPEIHDTSRIYESGRASSRKVRSGIELLNDHEVPFGILMVVGEKALDIGAERVWNFFLHDLGVKRFSFLAARPDNTSSSGERPTTEYTTADKYVNFMKDIFDLWLAADDPLISIREIDSLLGQILGGTAKVCTLAGDCIGQYFHIEANGDVYHCDKYLGDLNYRVGNILTDDFDSIAHSAPVERLRKDESTNLHNLNDCPSFAICNGGCPHDRYVARRSGQKNITCCGLRDLIEYIQVRLGPAIEAWQRAHNTVLLGRNIPIGRPS